MKPTHPTNRHVTDEENIIITLKKLIALAIVTIASHVVSASAGDAVASSKEVATPPPPLPTSYFRSDEFSLGVFGSYGCTYDNNVRAIGNHSWGGGVDGQYFPLQYLGFGLEGDFFNEVPGDFFGATVTGNVILRYPLDIKFPSLHLAPYAFGGVGGIFNQNSTFTRIATVGNAGDLHRRDTVNEVLGDSGIGLEYVLRHILDYFLTFATTL